MIDNEYTQERDRAGPLLYQSVNWTGGELSCAVRSAPENKKKKKTGKAARDAVWVYDYGCAKAIAVGMTGENSKNSGRPFTAASVPSIAKNAGPSSATWGQRKKKRKKKPQDTKKKKGLFDQRE